MSLSPENIYAVVRSIPRGKVTTYGQIAELAGVSNGHRIVARAMRSCPERLPWQRVVGKKDARRGQINIDDPDHAALQRGLLESEGVVFDARGFIPLARFGWQLDEPSSGRGARRRRPVAKGELRRAASIGGPRRRTKKRARGRSRASLSRFEPARAQPRPERRGHPRRRR
jgi:methylated-DNA-protein-cysteine methyltransferase related protein